MDNERLLERKSLEVDIRPQPNDETCGPTSLHAVYQYYDDLISLENVIDQVKSLKSGGTLGVMLGNHALKRGYSAKLITYDLQMFDPTWFVGDISLEEKLKEQLEFKSGKKFKAATNAYLKFLHAGGEISFEELNSRLIKHLLEEGTPILTGLSATYLYNCSREIPETNEYDDLKGKPAGHFVVIRGFDPERRLVYIADPLESNPISETQYYLVGIRRLINAILLGVVTYDANLLVIKPK
ncbi:MAG: C39 family peptidase [Bacteroidota bacterium]